MPSQSVRIVPPLQNLSQAISITMASEEDVKEKIEEPIMTNDLGGTLDTRGCVFACGD